MNNHNNHNSEINADNIIKVSGTPFEMGFQQGKKFAGQIQETFRHIIKFEGIQTIKPKILPNFIFSYLLKQKIVKDWKKLIEILAPTLYERMLGISNGAKTPLEELFVVQALEILSDDVSLVTTGGCTSFAVLPERYAGNEMILGKNFDFMETFKDDNIIRFSSPDRKFKSIELTYKQLSGSHDGMNEKGLVVLYNYGITSERTKTRLPITLLVQQILENCATVEEALILLESFRYPNAAILLIADSKDTVVSVEISPDHISHRHPDNGIIANTNMFLCPETKLYDLPHTVHYSKNAPGDLAGNRIHETNELRFSAAMNILNSEKGKLQLDTLKSILSDHNGKPGGDDNTVCRHGKFFTTQASAMFFPKHRKVLITMGTPCNNEYKEYKL